MSCTPTGPVVYSDSPFVAADLPIQYEIESCKWPVNTFDQQDTFHTVKNNNGFAQLELQGTYETYVKLQTVKVEGSIIYGEDTDAGQSGVYRIKSVESATIITIDAPYQGDDTGTVQWYYDNYEVEVQVYTGRIIPTVVNTFAARGTKRVKPDSSGKAIVDISDIVRQNIGTGYIENKLCDAISDNGSGIVGNDTNMWTSFYIEVREVYDIANGNTVSSFKTSYVEDRDELNAINYYFATKGTQQFQYANGRSMGEYDIGQVDSGEPVAKFLTRFAEPTYFRGHEFDLQILSSLQEQSGFTLEYWLREYDTNGTVLNTTNTALPDQWEGYYRFNFNDFTFDADTTYFVFWLQKDSLRITEQKTVHVKTSPCSRNTEIYLRWINDLGGWEGFLFTAKKEFTVKVNKRKLGRKNIYSNWDTNYKTGTTERFVSSVEAFRQTLCQSQFVTDGEREAMQYLILSPEVRRVGTDPTGDCDNLTQTTVIIEDDSYTFTADGQKLNEVRFLYTDTDPIRMPKQ